MDKRLVYRFLTQRKSVTASSYIALFEEVAFLIFQILTIN